MATIRTTQKGIAYLVGLLKEKTKTIDGLRKSWLAIIIWMFLLVWMLYSVLI